MINWTLLQPRNFIVIGLIVVAWHIVLGPVFNSMGKTDEQE